KERRLAGATKRDSADGAGGLDGEGDQIAHDMEREMQCANAARFSSPCAAVCGVMSAKESPMSAEPAVVALEGEIDLHQSAQVLARLDPLISARCPNIRVDLAGVTYMDSSGLATMIDAMQRTQAYGGEFTLAAIRPNVMKVFQIARL